MYLDQRIRRRISKVFSRMRTGVLLTDALGQVILPEGVNKEVTLPENVRTEPSKPCALGGWTYIGTSGSQPMYLALQGESGEVADCAILCAGLIGTLSAIEMPNESKEYAYQYLLRQEIEAAELEAISQECGIPLQENRCVILLHLYSVDMESVMSILSSVVDASEGSVAVEIDRHTVVLIQQVDERDDGDDLMQMALAIDNTFAGETNAPIFIGIGEPRKSLSQLRESMQEAKRAIEVGRLYHRSEHVFAFKSLLMERFLSDVPKDTAAKYAASLFNRGTARLLNDTMLHTIDKFFENSLNLSETARQLYIHRNTLVYRLDKVQKAVGLDLRSFDDAATFKLMMLLSKDAADKAGKR